jgi:predicted DNA-binding transcriptional regulator AlpA
MNRTISEYVTVREMMGLLGITREHVYKLMDNDPAFPKPFRFPQSTIRLWATSEVKVYAKQRNRKRGPRPR